MPGGAVHLAGSDRIATLYSSALLRFLLPCKRYYSVFSAFRAFCLQAWKLAVSCRRRFHHKSVGLNLIHLLWFAGPYAPFTVRQSRASPIIAG